MGACLDTSANPVAAADVITEPSMIARSFDLHACQQSPIEIAHPDYGSDTFNTYSLFQSTPAGRIDQTLHTRYDIVNVRLYGDTALEVTNPWGFPDLLRLRQRVKSVAGCQWRQTLTLLDNARVKLIGLRSDASSGMLDFELKGDCVLMMSRAYLEMAMKHAINIKVGSADSSMLIFDTAGLDVNALTAPTISGLVPGDHIRVLGANQVQYTNDELVFLDQGQTVVARFSAPGLDPSRLEFVGCTLRGACS
jgi:hypothetical protein